MQKILSFIVLSVLFSTSVWANSRTLNGINENEQLGMMAGLALACNAGGKLDDYELIASRILANSSQTDLEEKKAVRQYAQAKFKAYKEQKETPQAGCSEILESFEHLPIFKSVVYADGTLKMPDGKVLKPRAGAQKPISKKKIAKEKKK